MPIPRLTCRSPALVARFLLATGATAEEPRPNPAADQAAFEEAAAGAAWKKYFPIPAPQLGRKNGYSTHQRLCERN